MRKAFIIIIIAAILLAGVPGCKSVPHYKSTDASNARKIVLAVNAYNDLNPGHMLPRDVTLEDAKEVILEGKYWWPRSLTDENEKTAWEIIEIKDGKADLRQVEIWVE